MSYNILNKNVNFQGSTKGTLEDIVDSHSDQSITGSKDFLRLTGSAVYVKNSLGIGTTSPNADIEVVGTGGSTNTVRISHPELVYNSTNPFLSLNYNNSQQTLNIHSDGQNHWNIKASANDIRIDTGVVIILF